MNTSITLEAKKILKMICLSREYYVNCHYQLTETARSRSSYMKYHFCSNNWSRNSALLASRYEFLTTRFCHAPVVTGSIKFIFPIPFKHSTNLSREKSLVLLNIDKIFSAFAISSSNLVFTLMLSLSACAMFIKPPRVYHSTQICLLSLYISRGESTVNLTGNSSSLSSSFCKNNAKH